MYAHGTVWRNSSRGGVGTEREEGNFCEIGRVRSSSPNPGQGRLSWVRLGLPPRLSPAELTHARGARWTAVGRGVAQSPNTKELLIVTRTIKPIHSTRYTIRTVETLISQYVRCVQFVGRVVSSPSQTRDRLQTYIFGLFRNIHHHPPCE